MERAYLYRKIWAIAYNIRGAVKGWDFKQYILGILFYRFIWTYFSEEETREDFKVETVNSQEFLYYQINYSKM